jgi:hypothetical protein
MNKKLLITSLLMSTISFAQAQVQRINVVEHFTNTSCGVCAGTNPGINTALAGSTNALRISFHPSAPYANDFFNQQNKTENDGRTNYYNIYGATPRVVFNGKLIATNKLADSLAANTTDLSNFNLALTHSTTDSITFSTKLIIKRMAADTLTTASIFVAAAEDSIKQTTNNGEAQHYNVFRKLVALDTISLPANVGDSVIINGSFIAQSTWLKAKVYAVAILQALDKTIVQGARSTVEIPPVVIPNNITQYATDISTLKIFPNPSSTVINLSEHATSVNIYNMQGRLILSTNNTSNINITQLPVGQYLLNAQINEQVKRVYFSKQ